MTGLITSSFGLVGRALPQPTTDNVEREVRISRYGDCYAYNVVPTKHVLDDEGSYFIANNGQTAISGQTQITFTATAPTISIFNSDSAGNPSSKRIYLDYNYLVAGGTAFTSGGTGNVATFVAVTLDSQDGVTGGTLLSPVCANMDTGTKSVAIVRFGALAAPAVTANARTIVGQRLVRCPVTTATLSLANVDQYLFNFGGVDFSMALPNAASATLEANAVGRTVNLPPVVIGPGQSVWVYVFTSTSVSVTPGNYFPEIGWWER
jgi:hypothetical protein